VLSTTWDYSSAGAAVYEYWQGTSMAAPHVTGVAALMLGQGCPASRIRPILQSTATDLGTAGFDNEYGYGLINAKSALDAASPDLYITYLRGMGAISRLKLEDGWVVFKWRVKNKGCGISRSAVMKFWLSSDNHRGGGDIYLGSRLVRSLAGGTSTALAHAKFALKKSVDPNKRWYICARVDASKVVNEGFETNNEKSGRLTDR